MQFTEVSGYTIILEKVQRTATRMHNTSEHQNRFLLWVLAFLTTNCISLHDKEYLLDDTQFATSISLNAYGPISDDYELLQIRMKVIVM